MNTTHHAAATVLADGIIRRHWQTRGQVDALAVAHMTGLTLIEVRAISQRVRRADPTHMAAVARLRAAIDAETLG